MSLNAEKIRESLHTPVTVRLYDSIDSTNNEAKRRAETDSGVCLYATQHQTAGRGRRGHSFYSPKDTGLYMTLTLPLTALAPSVQRITCAAAVAVCEAVEALSGQRPQIKWVNDIYLSGKKAAGILTELLTDSKNQPRSVIVGIGLNLNTKDFPEEFAQNAGNLGAIEVNALCGTIADRLMRMVRDLNHHSVIEKYKQRSNCIGRLVTYQRDGAARTARAVDIDEDGGLVVEENGIPLTLNSGEISVRLT
ncbi:biotin--[acetyl-CoA-carboxylase] ligase [Ruminococcus sp.]|uniref:biotin--[acetyl-CoA-carboxylase] ligase n=1 Tax=Ruminococcus sp. TaxID=41978 RepID=UPI00388DDDD3